MILLSVENPVGSLAAAIEFMQLGLLGRLILAALMGGVIGVQRETRGKAAGFRTNMVICIGSALVCEVSIGITSMGGGVADPGRLAAQAISACGFLAAGVIMRSRGRVEGITTAATIWVVVGIGLAIGARMYVPAIGTTILVLTALALFGRFDALIRRGARSHRMQVELRAATNTIPPVRGLLEAVGLEPRLVRAEMDEEEGRITAIFHLEGKEEDVRSAMESLMENPRVFSVSSS